MSTVNYESLVFLKDRDFANIATDLFCIKRN